MELNSKTLDESAIISGAITYTEARRSHVYFLIYKGIIVYVGKASHYESRFKSHKADKLFDSYYITECTEDKVKEIESYYISMFKPIYNVSENLEPLIENGTYVRHQDVLLLNAGGRKSSYRKILDVKGSRIIDAFSGEYIGWVINKAGYIYDGHERFSPKWMKCQHGKIEFIKIPINSDIFCKPNSKDIKIEYINYDKIDTVYELYIYSKIKQYKPFWFVSQCKERKMKSQQWILDIIDFLFSTHTVTMKAFRFNGDSRIVTITTKKSYTNNRKQPPHSSEYVNKSRKEFANYECINTPEEIRNFWRKKNGLK